MNLYKYKHIIFSVVTGSLLLFGLFLFLNGTAQTARANPASDIFASPTGSGSACSSAQPCSLQTALSQSIDGHPIYLAMGTYTGSGAAVVTVTKNIAIRGGWNGEGSIPPVRDPDKYITILDGEGQRRVVYISGSINPTLEGLHLINGATTVHGGGIHAEIGSHTSIDNCQIYSNTSGSDGAGVYIRGDAAIWDSKIYANTAQGNGGGLILIHNNGTTLTDNQIYDNRAYWGGGVQTYKSSATLTNNDIYSNTAQESGGGVNLNETDSHHVALITNRIYSNTATYGGAVIAGNCFVTMTANLIYGNSAVQSGGVHFCSSDAVLVNNMLVDNQTTSGNGAGGVFVAGSNVRLLHTTFARNSGGRVGGILATGFYAETSSVAMTNTILVSHTIGILVDSGHTAMLEATLWGDNEWSNGSDWSGAGTITTGTVNIWGVPAFLSPDAGDYHILPFSAAVDMGVDAGVTTDIDNDPRPSPAGSSPDLGADEVSQRDVYLPLVIFSD